MILTTEVEIIWWGNGAKFLKSLGFSGSPKEKFLVPISLLPSKSDKKVERKCELCGKIEKMKYHEAIKHKKYCAKCYRSKILIGKNNPKYKEISHNYCIDCGKEITPFKNYTRCKKCFGKYNSGKNHYRWIEERSLKKKRNGNMQRWSLKIKEKFKHTCVICNSKTNIVAHHLDGVSTDPNKMYDENNGICLCEECHKKFHKEYGYGNNTKEQFEEFYKITKKDKNV